MASQFRVDFRHKQKGSDGDGTRARLQGTIGQALKGSQSETAVLKYLENKYRGEEITIMKLDFI